jgi:predicted permease
MAVQFLVTIAIGMGAATALVSLLLALGYEPLPFRDPGSLVQVWERREPGTTAAAISGPDMADFADATHGVFSTVGAFVARKLWLVDRRGTLEVSTCFIQAGIFSDLGIQPVLGRGVRLDDDLSGSATSPAWISYRLWRSRYGGSPAVIGTLIGLAASESEHTGMDMRIAGVLPPGVSLPLPFMENTADVWYLTERNIAGRPRESAIFFGIGRLRPGVTAVQAQSALTVVAQRLEQSFRTDRHKRPVVEGLETIAQAPARQTMGLLVLGVAFVFLVGCINLAILMGAEGRQRRQEIAIRAALGASARRLWYEVAAEKCLLTVAAFGLGVVFAAMLLRVLAQLLPAAGLGPPLPHPPPLNLAVLLGFGAFTLAATLVWSALLVSASDGPQRARGLAAAGGGSGHASFAVARPGARRWRLVLLAAQAGIGICLLSAAALATRTYSALSVADLGPAPRRTVLLSVATRDNVVLSDAQVADFNQRALSRLQSLPGTQSIAQADLFPPGSFPISFSERGDPAGVEREATLPISVSSGYFPTLGIPILFGRDFDSTDSSRSEPVAILSLDMATQNWSSPKQAVGSQISIGSRSENRFMVIGVAADFTGYWSRQPIPTIYVPEAQSVNWCGTVILRTGLPAKTVAMLAPQILSGMAIPVTISDVSTLQERWQATLTRPLARMAGMLLLALLGIGLSVQGVYAFAAGTVTERTHDLAVRSALGASQGRLIWNVTGELVLSVLAGSVCGVAAVFELQPLLGRLIGTTGEWQTQPIVIAVLLLALAAAAGCYFPARAAIRANPIEALRQS